VCGAILPGLGNTEGIPQLLISVKYQKTINIQHHIQRHFYS
jgi:hypothetical protein